MLRLYKKGVLDRSLVGSYRGYPIYRLNRVPKEWVAMTTDDGKGVCINDEAYDILRRAPKARTYIEAICRHEISGGPVHEHIEERSSLEKEIIQLLNLKQFLE